MTPLFSTYNGVVKHVALFLLGILWLLFVVSFGTHLLFMKVNNEKTETRLIIARTLILVLGVITLFSFQLNYYIKVDSYIDYRCEYYDEHYNLIFASPRIYFCPEINVIDEGESDMVFTTTSTYQGISNLNSLDFLGIASLNIDTIIDVESFTKTTIRYDENNKIIYFHNQLTEVISHDETSVYYSSSKIVESSYLSDSFETTVSTAFVIDYHRDDTLHFAFEDTDYENLSVYTSRDNILDYPVTDIDYYIIQSNDSAENDIVVGLGFDTGDVMYNLTEDQYSFSVTEFGNWSQIEGTYYRVASRNQFNSLGINDNIYSLGYELKEDGYYTLITKQEQEPDEYTFQGSNSWSFGKLTFQDNGNYSYYVMDGIYYTFVPTDYGYKVIDRRNQQYKLFSSLDNQVMEDSLSIMNDQYLNLHEYYKNLTIYPYFVPQVMVVNPNPFYLKDLE